MIYASPTPFLWGSYLSQPGICLTAQQVCPKKSGSDRHSEKTMILQSFSSRILEKEWNSSFSLPFINSVKHTRARVRYHANWQSAQFIVTNKVSLSNFEAIITVGRKLAGIFPASSTSLNMFFFLFFDTSGKKAAMHRFYISYALKNFFQASQELRIERRHNLSNVKDADAAATIALSSPIRVTQQL